MIAARSVPKLLLLLAAAAVCLSAVSAAGNLRGGNGPRRHLAAAGAGEDTEVRDLTSAKGQLAGLGLKPDKVDSPMPIPGDAQDMGTITISANALKQLSATAAPESQPAKDGEPHRRLAGPDIIGAFKYVWYPTWCCGGITTVYVQNSGDDKAYFSIHNAVEGSYGVYLLYPKATMSFQLKFWGFDVKITNYGNNAVSPPKDVPLTTWTV